MAVTLFATSPAKRAFEADARNLTWVAFGQLVHDEGDAEVVEGIKTCADLGIEVRGMPFWASELMKNSAYAKTPVTYASAHAR